VAGTVPRSPRKVKCGAATPAGQPAIYDAPVLSLAARAA